MLERHSGLTLHTVRLAVFSLGIGPSPYTPGASLGPANVFMCSKLVAGGAGLGSCTHVKWRRGKEENLPETHTVGKVRSKFCSTVCRPIPNLYVYLNI